MNQLTQLAAWHALQQHYEEIANHSMQEWFATDAARFENFSVTFNHILFDYSKNRVTHETMRLLIELAREANLAHYIDELFSGRLINFTEQRPALHTALRDRKTKTLLVNGKNVMQDIHATLAAMQQFVDQVRAGTWVGATGKSIVDIVNIGIGGSHLGPLMVTQALADSLPQERHCYFISNCDGSEIQHVLQKINPERTLFIISSKSFTTFETISNAEFIQQWLREKLGIKNVSAHFVAVTANIARAKEFGIPDAQIFPIWEWVGGRYSIWSAIGLPVALMIGMDKFYEFLDGAHQVDLHFRESEFSNNIPVLMALLGLWYINFFGSSVHAITPYAYELKFFRDYIQQADMESNGKSVSRENHFIDYATAPIIIGQQGCDSQHSFFQLIHQSARLIPIDFILVAHTHFQHQQDILVANAISQAQALLQGKSYEENFNRLRDAGYAEKEAQQLALHKTIPGNRPSNLFFINKLTPSTLGSLIAFYEHKIFVQGILWGINSFDQWGVELGKELLPAILLALTQSTQNHAHDSSTNGLIHYYMQLRNSS